MRHEIRVRNVIAQEPASAPCCAIACSTGRPTLPVMTTFTLPPSTTDRRRSAVGLAALTATFSLWGMVVVAPTMTEGLPPTLLAGGRYLLHGAASLGLLQLVGAPSDPARWRRAALHAVTGFVGYYGLLTIAVRTGGATLVVLTMAVSPVVYLLAGRPDVRWRRLALPAMAIVAGGVLATVEGPVADLPAPTIVVTVALVAAAVAMWTWYGHDNARVVAAADVDLTQWTATTGVAAGLLSLPLVAFGLTQAPPSAQLATPVNLTVVAVLGLGCTTLANRFWNAASRRLAPTVVGPLLVVETVFAMTYVHLADGRLPAGHTLLGELLLVGGAAACLLVLRRAR